MTTSFESSSIFQLGQILTIYYVVVLFCALHATAANCEHTGGDNIMLTFHFHIAIVSRNKNRRFVLRFKEGEWAIRPSFYGMLQMKVKCKLLKSLHDHPNTI